jgi:hypothetical protein
VVAANGACQHGPHALKENDTNLRLTAQSASGDGNRRKKHAPLVDIGLEFPGIVRLMMTWRAGVSTPL